MTTATESVGAEVNGPRQNRAKAIFGGAIGNLIEWFENTSYAALAVIIGANFFDPNNPTAGVLATFGVFAIAFVFRPIGGIFFGWLGDRYGRRVALGTSVILMGAATAAIGLLPTYATIGVVAPILLMLIRCIQGLAIGGEWGSSAVFLGEHANPKRRAAWASLTPAGGWLGTGLAIGLVWVLTVTLGSDVMNEWGWRIPFLAAAPLTLVGLWVRMSLADTPDFLKLKAAGLTEAKGENKLKQAWRTSKKQMFIVFMVAGVHAAFIFFAVAYMVTYLQGTIGIDPGTALLTNTIAVTLGTIPTILWGVLADRVGRRRILIIGTALLAVIGVPMLLIIGTGSAVAVLLGQLLLVACVPLLSAPLAALCVELFEPEVRATAASVSTAIGAGVFGGAIPLISASLVSSTGNPLSPGWFLTALAVATLIVVVFMLKETAPNKTGKL